MKAEGVCVEHSADQSPPRSRKAVLELAMRRRDLNMKKLSPWGTAHETNTPRMRTLDTVEFEFFGRASDGSSD
ncbi:hypothetical protein AWB79_06234 [Caballeronia hypogeia]|uniref:Uncharacterized protein n=1 Tax=Caballeronia hypogeia TaxID=1777140 RepID=A0A158CZJ4_9BURK|nr:hypothetical protein AWB79_06234 [Caballeronia hypogeia]